MFLEHVILLFCYFSKQTFDDVSTLCKHQFSIQCFNLQKDAKLEFYFSDAVLKKGQFLCRCILSDFN